MDDAQRRLRVSRFPGSLTASLLATILLTTFSFALEPPRAGEIEQLRAAGQLQSRLDFAYELGNDKFDPSLVARANSRLGGVEPVLPPSRQGMPTTGSANILAILIAFSDTPFTNSAASIDAKLFGAGNPAEAPYESLASYYARSSYGLLDLSGGSTLGWYTTTYPRSSVPETWQGRESLIKEVLDYWDGVGHDFTRYDNDGDGAIDYLVVIWTGPDNGWSNFWWGYKTSFINSSSAYRWDGKRLSTYSWQWESRPVGGTFTPKVVIHETGHGLGLPDYYDYDGSVGPDGGVGNLDMMDANVGDHNCFSKWMLDWIDPAIVSSGSQTRTLRSSGTYQDAVMIKAGGDSSQNFSEYFMVQNRHKEGNDDQWYPSGGDGMLIWHVDATLNASGTNFLYNNSYSDHKLLRLMEADGLEEIVSGGSADADDYFNTGSILGPSSTPSSSLHDGSDSLVTVDQFSAAASSMTARFCIAPSAPVSPSPGDNGVDISVDADLDWVDGGGAATYDVYFGTDSTPDATELLASDTAGSSYTLDPLAPATTYYWKIVSKNSCGTSTGPVWSFTTAAPCAAPSAAVSPSPGHNAVDVTVNADLDWVDGGGATGYDVYFGTDSTPDATELVATDIAASSHSLDPLAAATTYYWQIVSKNSCGTTDGPVWQFTTAAPCAGPADPTGVSASDGTYIDRIAVSWSAAAGADSYEVYRHTADTFGDASRIDVTASTSVDDAAGLLAGVTYHYWVVAQNSCGSSGYGGPDTGFLQTPCSAPAAAGNPRPLHRAEDAALDTGLDWGDAADATGYDVYFGTDPTPDSTELRAADAAVSAFDPGPLTAGTTYYWKITAKNSCGTTAGPVWRFATSSPSPRDWNGDGHLDIVARNRTTGRNVVAYMNDTRILGLKMLPGAPAHWDIVGIDDCDGDDRPDLIFHDPGTGGNEVWYMNGAVSKGTGTLPRAPAGWTIVGTGDFEGDGGTDFLARNASLGWNVLAYMDGTALGRLAFLPSAPPAWEIVGVEEFDNAGSLDIVLQNGDTGESEVWYMNGHRRLGVGSLPQPRDGLAICGAGDYDEDGSADLLMRDYGTGENEIWYLKGTVFLGTGTLRKAGPPWTVFTNFK